jgi:hypothetical protein
MMNNTKITDFKKTNINIPVLTLPDVNCNILGTHYACFLGDKVWCKK